VASSWEGDPIEVSGRIGALYTKNGITFVWWQDSTSSGGYWLGYVNGGQLSPLRRYSGSLPNHAQVGEYEGYLAWLASGKLFLYGARDKDLPVIMFQYVSGRYTTNGAFACPFGTPLISASSGSNYCISKASGYTVTSSGKSLAFKMSGPGFVSQIDLIQVETEQLSSGAKVDFTLTYDKARSTLALTQIAYSASDNTTIHKIMSKGLQVEDFRLDWDFANGSTSNPVKIRSIMINGHFIKKN
jgi:hypothetical protein